MCGILGSYSNSGINVDVDKFRIALQALHHRGPDGSRVISIDPQVLFGHARLAIVDTSHDSDQPMQADERYWLTYNGEIFNYIELREELKSLGHEFHTSGDVEVLLRSYIEWGADCVEHFNGMWAFAIYDQQKGELFCSRDRFGIKPFNYAVTDSRFVFASEIKAILALHPELAQPDFRMIANFCRTSTGAQHEQTWFSQIKRLMPAHNLRISAAGIEIWRYWDYPLESGIEADFEKASTDYRRLFEDAVRLRMRSDVPVGITLSSGVDSNSIAFAMQQAEPAPHFSFTSCFGGDEQIATDSGTFLNGGSPIDESVVAVRTSKQLGLESRLISTDYGRFVDELSTIIWHLESGHGSPAVLPLFQLLKAARREVTVVLDGQGADELLAGYIVGVITPSVIELAMQGRFSDAWRNIVGFRRTYRMRSGFVLFVRTLVNRFPWIGRIHGTLSGIEAIYGPKLKRHKFVADYPDLQARKGEGRLSKMLRRQHAGGLVNLLHYGDAISMANSIEARMPFLDHRLVEAVWPMPAFFKVREGLGKFIHRHAMRGLVDDDILNDTNKFGYTSPISEQFRKGKMNDNPALQILLSERCLGRGLFEKSAIYRLIERHHSGRVDHGTLLFRLLSTELWFRNFIDAVLAKQEQESAK